MDKLPQRTIWITSLKIEFNQGTNWFMKTHLKLILADFETVLHELGHCFQLGHDGDPRN